MFLVSCDTNAVCPAASCTQYNPCEEGYTCLEEHGECVIPCVRDSDCPNSEGNEQNIKCYTYSTNLNYCIDGDGLAYNYCIEELSPM